jgi:PAS domain S-box-containing protein
MPGGPNQNTETGEEAALRARLAELERERELLNAIANYAPSLLCLINPDGRVRPTATNEAFERRLGYEPEETGGVVFWERYVPPEDSDEVRAAIEGVTAGGEMEPRDGRWLTRDGEIVHVLWSCTALPMIETGPLWLISASDITERKHHEEEVLRSRARIVAAADEARKRLERNLHDGAQQRLLSLLISVRAARSRDQDLGEIVDWTTEELAAAVEELRELARGIHPDLLSRSGLAAALAVVAERAPVPVELEVPTARYEETVEATSYYVVAEALGNTARHAQATRAVVSVRPEGGQLVVEVEDDGVGGADESGGTGLRGLADRLEAVSGTFTVESPPGRGTRIRAEIPLGADG